MERKNFLLVALLLICKSILFAQLTTFNYTGGSQNYVVPSGVTVICFTVDGAQGNGNASNNMSGGLGGRLTGQMPVTPGQVLQINVGGGGLTNSNAGGFNGGANGGVVACCAISNGGGGGGASDIRINPYTLNDRVAVGGGGGGTGGNRNVGCAPGCGGGGGGGWYGGGGGGAYGGSPGFGGTQIAGGAGGASCCGCPLTPLPGAAGTFGAGGIGGGMSACNNQGGNNPGCAGGVGGALTGGQGPNCTGGTGCPSTWAGASGGGGSNYAAGIIIGPVHTAGLNSGNGRVIIQPNCCTTPTLVPVANPNPICAGQSVNLTVTGAGNGGTYTWTPGPITGSNINVTPSVTTTYTVTGTNTLNCVGSKTLLLTVNPSPTITATPQTTAICAGKSATIVAGGAVSYTTNPGNIIGSNIIVTPAATTVYTITGSSALGCTANITATVTVNPLPVVVPGANSPVCAGGTLSLTVGAFNSYTWAGPNGFASNLQNPTISNMGPVNAGNYTVSVINASGCTASNVINVVVNPTLTITPGNFGPYCAGAAINLTVAAASTYTWIGPNSFSSNIQNPAIANSQTIQAGVYTVNVTNASGCVSSGTTLVVVNPKPTPTITSNSPLCIGSTLNLTVNPAVASYTWSGPNSFASNAQSPSVANVTTLSAGNYTVIVTSTAGCTGSAVANVVVNLTPTISATNTGPYCAGATISMSVSAANTYTWSGPSAFSSNVQSPTIANSTTLNSGNYTVTIASVGGCTNSAVTNVVVNTSPSPTATSNSPVCVGKTINFNGLGGTTYTWTGPGGFTSNAQNPTITTASVANAGNYTLSVTNTFGCTNSVVVNVVINPLPVIAVNNPTTCVGSTFTLTATGGTAYAWSGPNAFNSAVQNPPFSNATTPMSGNYTVIVTSAQGCTNSAVANASVIVNPTISATNTGPYCAGATISMSVSAANTYTWSGPNAFSSNVQSPTIANSTTLNSGNYTVTIASVGGCTNSALTNLVVNALPTPTATSNSPVCVGKTINFNGLGGTTYTWSGPGGFSSNAQNPSITTASVANAGNYTLSVTNANGCTNSVVINVVINLLPVIAVNNPTTCVGSTFTLTATGGTAYAWTGPGSFNSASQNPPFSNANTAMSGNYTVIVTSAQGCTNSAVANASVVTLPTVSVIGTTTLCSQNFNGSNNTTTLTASGAGTYAWTLPVGYSGSPNLNTSPLIITGPVTALQTVATVTVVGTAGSCTNNAVYTITALPNPTISVTSGSVCAGSSLTLTSSGANTYTWLPTSNLNTPIGSQVVASPAQTSVYSVVGTSLNCNSQTQTATVTVVANPVLVISPVTPTICAGSPIGLTAFGANNYTWSPAVAINTVNGSFVIVNPMVTTNYTLVGEAATCTSSIVRQVLVTPLPLIQAVSNKTAICLGDKLNINANGANNYLWMPSTGLSSNNSNFVVASPQVSTIYTITGSNSICSKTITFAVNVLTRPVLNISAVKQKICFGESTAIFASGCQTYSWHPSGYPIPTNTTVAMVTPTANMNFTITGYNGADSSACPFTKEILIEVVPQITPTAIWNVGVCEGGSVKLNAGGSNTYRWMPWEGLTNPNIAQPFANPKTTTIYTVNVSDNGFCGVTTTVMVSVYPQPTINAGADMQVNSDEIINLNANGTGTLTWIFGDNILCAVCPNSQITPTRSGIYKVQATNQYGCKATDDVWVELTDDYPIFIPNSFTPNFDGLNDVFLVYGQGIIKFELMIFNKWHHLLFTSNDQLIGWDGIYKGGIVKNDSYIYVINYTTFNGRKYTKTGFVAVVREDY